MSSTISAQPGDTKKYFYRDISESIPNPNIKAAVKKNDDIVLFYGAIPGISEDLNPRLAKINLTTQSIAQTTCTFNAQESSDVYSDALVEKNIDTPCNFKAFVWNNNLVTIAKTISPYHGVTLIKLNLDSFSLTLTALTAIPSDTYIADISNNDSTLYILGKTGYTQKEYNKIYAIDISSSSGDGCPTVEYTFNSILRGGQSFLYHNGSLLFFGGKVVSGSTIEDCTDKYYKISIDDLGQSDILNENNIVSLVPMPSSYTAVPFILDNKAHIASELYLYSLNIIDGSLDRISLSEEISANIFINEANIYISYDTGKVFETEQIGGSLLDIYGSIQFYDSNEEEIGISGNLITETVKKIDNSKFISRIKFSWDLILNLI